MGAFYHILKKCHDHLVQNKIKEKNRSKVYSLAVEISIMFSPRSLEKKKRKKGKIGFKELKLYVI